MLVGVDEQIKRLSAARFQLDVMKVPGIIVARTDAEAATFLEGRGDERDHPFILGATNVELPTYKAGYLAILRKLHQLGIDDARGYLLYQISAAEHDEASAWLERTGVMRALEQGAQAYQHGDGSSVDALLDRVGTSYLEVWQSEANLSSYPQAVAEVIEFRSGEGERCEMSAGEWLAFASRASFHSARARAKSMGIDITWDCEAPKTPEGYYQIQSGIEYAVARSLAVASFADLLWMETKTANLADARGQHYFRRDRRPPGPQHPLGPGPEHLRGRPAPKRLMTLCHLFLVHRYKIWAVHYVSPTDDNRYQAQKMKTHGLFSDVHDEVGHIIVADVSTEGVKALLAPDQDRLNALIQRKHPYTPVEVSEQIPETTTA